MAFYIGIVYFTRNLSFYIDVQVYLQTVHNALVLFKSLYLWLFPHFVLYFVCNHLFKKIKLAEIWLLKFLKIHFFNWRIIALQNFVVFCQTSAWISHGALLTAQPERQWIPWVSTGELPGILVKNANTHALWKPY